MFEKEAEERSRRKISNFIPQQWGVSLIRTERTYETVEGAPHFYLRSLAKMWKEGAEYGYNKANEWHYVKDGKYPIDEKDVEVLYKDCDKINVYNCVYDIHAENWLYYNLDNMVLELFPFNVIAWKEIVLPKEE